ncbi:MAG: adenylyltransferase/cytidyltransferase family protein [Ilumatobacteraceae bacterium]
MADRTHPTALIVGRFNPPHLGHSFMIDWAAERVERLVVFVNTRDGELVPGEFAPAGWRSCIRTSAWSRCATTSTRTSTTRTCGRGGWRCSATAGRTTTGHTSCSRAIRTSTNSPAASGPRPSWSTPTAPRCRSGATMIRESPADHLDRLAPTVRAWVEANLM